jgi:hypothetical protein
MALTPVLGLVLGWAVIMFEVSFPLVLLTPLSIAIGILAIGVTFHLGSAVVMGPQQFRVAVPRDLRVCAGRARA